MKVWGERVSIANWALARAVLPAGSVATTSKPWEPSASGSGATKGEAHACERTASIEQTNATGSLAAKAKAGVLLVDLSAGRSSSVRLGAVVSTTKSTVACELLPTWSVAVTRKEWAPSGSALVTANGDLQGSGATPSTAQARVAGSPAENSKLGVAREEIGGGRLANAISGGLVSTVNVNEALPATSTPLTSKRWAPS